MKTTDHQECDYDPCEYHMRLIQQKEQNLKECIDMHQHMLRTISENGNDVCFNCGQSSDGSELSCPTCHGAGERRTLGRRFTCVPCSGTGKWLA